MFSPFDYWVHDVEEVYGVNFQVIGQSLDPANSLFTLEIMDNNYWENNGNFTFRGIQEVGSHWVSLQ